MIFETHAHYDDPRYDEDRDEVLSAMAENGIGTVMNIGADIETSKNAIALAEKYDFIYAAIGVHPEGIRRLDESGMEWLKANATHPKVKAIGEFGLDYNWSEDAAEQEQQRYWFQRQLDLAVKLNLPFIIHSRDAAEDTMTILKKFAADHPEISQPGVVHCYSYSAQMAKEYVDMGYYIGVGGVVTFKNGRKLVETVEQTPLERIVLETDAPYLTPEPHRGTRNVSYYLHQVAERIAQIKGITKEEVVAVTEENARRLYRF